MSEYQATLPDGSPMVIEILHNSGGVWAGEFAVGAETGPYAHQTGSFEGSIDGNVVTATCEAVDGTEFQLTGTADGDKSLQLTRSDIPGTVLLFLPVAPPAPAASAVHAVITAGETSFNLNTGGSSGRLTLSTTPYSSNTSMTEYRGKWLGVPVTFWAYAGGYASIVIYAEALAIASVNFSTYRLADFPTATRSSVSSQTSIYNIAVKQMMNFRGTATASP